MALGAGATTMPRSIHRQAENKAGNATCSVSSVPPRTHQDSQNNRESHGISGLLQEHVSTISHIGGVRKIPALNQITVSYCLPSTEGSAAERYGTKTTAFEVVSNQGNPSQDLLLPKLRIQNHTHTNMYIYMYIHTIMLLRDMYTYVYQVVTRQCPARAGTRISNIYHSYRKKIAYRKGFGMQKQTRVEVVKCTNEWTHGC